VKPDTRDTLRFFALTYAISWIAMIPVVLSFRGLAVLPEALVGLCAVVGSSGPSIAAIALVLVRREGLRSLVGQPQALATRLVWLLVALLFPLAFHYVASCVIGTLIVVITNPQMAAPVVDFNAAWPTTPDQRGIAVVAPLGEEVGWRGYAQRRLERDLGPVRAGFVIGLVWCLWHAPMWFAAAPPLSTLVAGAVFVVAGGVLFAGLFRWSKGSLLVAIVAHFGVHLDNVSRVGGMELFGTAFVAVVVAS